VNDSKLNKLVQIRSFLAESEAVEFNRKNRKEVYSWIYSWIEETLIIFQYAILPKKGERINQKISYEDYQLFSLSADQTHLLPLLEKMIASYLYRIIHFHCDNGSEYINQKVAAMLNNLLIKLTKSRPRHTNAMPLWRPKTAG
jgi:hypothetical protein